EHLAPGEGVDRAVGEAAEAEAGDVVEVADAGAAGVVRIGELADVDRSGIELRDAFDLRVDLDGQAEGLAEVAAGAAGEEGEAGVGIDGAVVLEEAVDDFVDGAVAADGEDEIGAGAEGLARERGGRHE